MLLDTPLPRPSTFLTFNPRRVSAPPPSPKDKKRRSALSLWDTPPKCRRRLSFADADLREYALPPAPPTALIALSQKLSAAQDRVPVWRAVLSELTTGVWGGEMFAAALVAALESGNRQEVEAAAPVLPFVARRAGQTRLVAAVLHAVINHPDSPAVEPLAKVIRDDQWGRLYAPSLASRAARLRSAVVKALTAPGIDIGTWDALLSVLSATCTATRSARRDAIDCEPFDISVGDAADILASFDRVAPRGDAAATERALNALKVLFGDKATVAVFATENAAAIIAEVSALFSDRLPIQHVCVDLLASLSSPKILYYITSS